ncbi:MAG: RNA polymerase subunit sigma-70 [Actinomycetota bacterium]|nr:RNA polymerase subunit sigma-70 [Actinomycetota bacterium]
MSRHETPTTPSHTETPAPETERSTPADAVLVVAATAALAARAAVTQLAHAIAAARDDGRSWRTIAIATGIPHQTLHRRRRRERGT